MDNDKDLSLLKEEKVNVNEMKDENDYKVNEDNSKQLDEDIDAEMENLEDEDEDTKAEDEEMNEIEIQELSENQVMLRIIQSLPLHESLRHEQFRRSHFERGAIKRCMTDAIATGMSSDKRAPNVTTVMAIVMAGMSKVFVGELTKEARRIMEKRGESGPIQIQHLQQAYRQYYRKRPLARSRSKRRLLR